jgi:SAM-dependent methyltransferase
MNVVELSRRVRRRSSDEWERRRWDRRAGLGVERWTIGDGRAWVCSQASGHVLEVCVGTGLNLPHYADEVRLIAIDINPDMLGMARRRATEIRRRRVDLLAADGTRLPFKDESFDSVVCTLGMCEFPDRGVVLAEMYRLLRPHGRLLLLDHAQWRWPAKGRPVTCAVGAGFVTERHVRRRLGLIELLAARKPDAAGIGGQSPTESRWPWL